MREQLGELEHARAAALERCAALEAHLQEREGEARQLATALEETKEVRLGALSEGVVFEGQLLEGPAHRGRATICCGLTLPSRLHALNSPLCDHPHSHTSTCLPR